uniref:SAM domain-containing protein n=1 Tax=Chlamydomonas euryale TaxID=1486919 RepID=A0A7R9VRY3_9CHLO|mmetsp:Transcript_4274/g.12307  ORF Transcript_4274/g.12307 Transcript_4274/m.12307 type:complete len:446 (+) Transcript_4274:223-1560(+)
MAEHKPAELWNNDEVCAYLDRIGLSADVPAFRDNEVVGSDLASLTDDELKTDLGISKLHARRIKRYLEDGGASYAPSSDASAEPASEPLPPTTGNVPLTSAVAALDAPDLGNLRVQSGTFQRWPVAAEAPATGVPVPEQSVATCDPGIVAKYKETTELIRRLDGEQVATRAPAVRHQIDGLKSRIKTENEKLQTLLKSQAKTSALAEKLIDDKWVPGKFMFKAMGKSEDKRNEAQQAAQEVDRQVAAVGKVLEDLNRVLATKTAEMQKLTGDIARLNEAKAWEVTILPQVFQGSNGDDRENQLEKEVDGMIAPLTTARQYMSSYTQAYQLIKTGRKMLDDSMQNLTQAVGLANLDVVGNIARPLRRHGPMETMGDVMRNQRARAGCELANKACDVLLKVYAIIPDVPKIKVEEVKALRGMGLMSIMFDNLLVDLVVRRKIMAAQQ